MPLALSTGLALPNVLVGDSPTDNDPFDSPNDNDVFDSPTDAEPSTLPNGLIAFWNLGEDSDGSAPVQRNDSHNNGLHLTDNNTVVSGTGVSGSGTSAVFVAANSERLSRASESLLAPKTDTDFAFAGWARIETNATNNQRIVWYQVTSPSVVTSYELLTASGTLLWRVRNPSGSAVSTTVPSAPVLPTAGMFFFFYVDFDAATWVARLSMNNGAFYSSASLSDGANTNTGNFTLGGTSAGTLTGRLQAIGRWDRKLTDDEIHELFNGPFELP